MSRNHWHDMRDCIIVRNDWIVTHRDFAARIYGHDQKGVQVLEYRKQEKLHDDALQAILKKRKVYHMGERKFLKNLQGADVDGYRYALVTEVFLTPSLWTRFKRTFLRKPCYASFTYEDPDDE